MYQVNNQPFESYMTAVAAARAVGAEVFEVREDGSQIRRWAPAEPVSAKKNRIYRERLAAYEAQQKAR